MPTPLILLGAGGLGREVAEAVRATNAAAPTWDLLGFVDDRPEMTGTTVDGIEVLGGTADLVRLEGRVAVCVASPVNPRGRKRLVERLGLNADRVATVVHPAAVLPTSARLGAGSIVLAGVVATTGVAIGRHVVIMPGVVLTHDNVIGDFATIAAGVMVAGGVTVEQSAYLGSGARVRENVRIGSGAVVGMGSVVLQDVPPEEVWAGVPARRLPQRGSAAGR